MGEPEWGYACHPRVRQRGRKRARDDAPSGTGSRPFTRIRRRARGVRIAAGSRRGLMETRMRAMFVAVGTLGIISASTARAQSTATIDPGMTREQVVAKIG